MASRAVPPRLNVSRGTDDDSAPEKVKPRNRKLLTAERRRQARRYRVAGLSAEAIALRLAADPSINPTGESFPGGYGSRNYADGREPPAIEALRKEVLEDLRIMKERTESSIERDEAAMFDIALERIEFVVAAATPRAANGSQLHQGRILEAVDLLAHIMGWHKSPVSVTVNNNTLNVSTSEQPTWDDVFLGKFYEAMIEAGAEPPEMLAAAQTALSQLPVAQAPPPDTVLVVDSTDADDE